jgi:very-short-patch-repair endonuclease
MAGLRFRRQHPIGNFIVDFYCLERRLVIELDGGGHAEEAQRRYDEARTRALTREGIRVMRFWNSDVLENLETVLRVIYEAAVPPSP